MSDCDHADFEASVEVHRFGDSATRIHMAEVKIQCAKCKLPFHFNGLGTGISFSKPTVNVPGTTLHVPIAPGERPLSDVGQMRIEMPES